MSKLDEIKNGAINDAELDEVNGGVILPASYTVAQLLSAHEDYVKKYKSAKQYGYDNPTSTRYNTYLEYVSTLDDIEARLDAAGESYPSRDA